MTDYAVVSVSGKQYKVSVGDKLVTENISGNPGDVLDLPVLLSRVGETVLVGNPQVKNQSVKAVLVSSQKGEKIRVFKYKAKARYRKTKGFRQSETILEIKSLGSSEARENEPVKIAKKVRKTVTKSDRKRSS